MGKDVSIVRMSSKGQVVIPAGLRRRLGLKTGQPLAVRAGAADELVLRPLEGDRDSVDDMLRRLRKASADLGRDLLAEFHERRRRERALEEKKRGERGDRRGHRHRVDPKRSS